MARKNPADTTIYQRKWRARNRAKVREYARRGRERNPHAQKEASAKYKAKYPERIAAAWRRWAGIPEAAYPHSGKCEACGKDELIVGTLQIDHCHETGKFRGWLCGRCNKALGLVGDSKSGVEKLLRYAERTS